MKAVKKLWKRWTIAAAAVLAVSCMAMPVMAEDTSYYEVALGNKNRPYLALGEDLSTSQKNTVLDLMGIDPDHLDEYDVVYITNKQEHQYLDSYIPKKEIGSRALSSVLVTKAGKGSGVDVTTYNITYCTTGMYENALVTAGISDADVVVAAPSHISGTAALVGAIEAYTVMTGEEPDEENVDAALNEMVITGQIEEESNQEPEQIEGMIANLKEQVAGGDISSEQEIQGAIDDAQKEFQISLTEEQQQQLLELLQKLQNIDLNLGDLKQQAQSMYDKLNDMGIDVDAIREEAGGFFSRLFQAIRDFFANLFG